MKRYLVILAALFSMILPVAATAQDLPVTPSPEAQTIKVPVGPYDFSVNGDDPLTVCVVGTSESLEGTFVSLQVIVRIESGDMIPVLSYTTQATGPFVEAHVDDCFVLAAR